MASSRDGRTNASPPAETVIPPPVHREAASRRVEEVMVRPAPVPPPDEAPLPELPELEEMLLTVEERFSDRPPR